MCKLFYARALVGISVLGLMSIAFSGGPPVADAERPPLVSGGAGDPIADPDDGPEAVLQLPDGAPATFAKCIACHGAGAEGNPQLFSPVLHNQQAWYIIDQLKKFREGLRGTAEGDVTGAQMRLIALQLSDDEITEIAEYISGLEGPDPEPKLKGNPKLGQIKYLACMGCHGVRGEGNKEVHAPALAGQQDWYIVSSLKKFKRRHRGYVPADKVGAQMKPLAEVLSEEDMRHVAAYIMTLGKGAP